MTRPRPITEADVDRGVQLAALLEVLAYAARSFEEAKDQSRVNRLTHNVGLSLELAAEVAGQLTARLEEHERLPDGSYRWSDRRFA